MRWQVSIESGLRQDLVDGLQKRGHNCTLFDINLGIAEVQAVMQTPDGWYYGECRVIRAALGALLTYALCANGQAQAIAERTESL